MSTATSTWCARAAAVSAPLRLRLSFPPPAGSTCARDPMRAAQIDLIEVGALEASHAARIAAAAAPAAAHPMPPAARGAGDAHSVMHSSIRPHAGDAPVGVRGAAGTMTIQTAASFTSAVGGARAVVDRSSVPLTAHAGYARVEGPGGAPGGGGVACAVVQGPRVSVRDVLDADFSRPSVPAAAAKTGRGAGGNGGGGGGLDGDGGGAGPARGVPVGGDPGPLLDGAGRPLCDGAAAAAWVYPTNVGVREYQQNISRVRGGGGVSRGVRGGGARGGAQVALHENTLVSLPTGLGKTLIASVVMFNYYRCVRVCWWWWWWGGGVADWVCVAGGSVAERSCSWRPRARS